MRARANGRNLSGLVTVCLASTFAVSANAADLARGQAYSLDLTDSGKCDDGRMDGDMKNRGPGYEQSSLFHSNGYVVVVTMRSIQEPGLGPWQLECISSQMQENAPPKVVGRSWLTRLGNGERVANHPSVVCENEGAWANHCAVFFGSDTNSNRPNLYAKAFTNQCQILGDHQMLSMPRDANDGAPSSIRVGNGTFVTSYYSDGGEGAEGGIVGFDDGAGRTNRGGDYTVAGKYQFEKQANGLVGFKQMWSGPGFGGGFVSFTEMGATIDIGRPSLSEVPGMPGWTFACAPQFGNRPSLHIGCATIDPDGKVKSRSRVFEGNAAMKMYYNQVSTAQLPGMNGGSYIAVNSNSSNAGGKNTNVKGTNTQNVAIAKVAADGSISVVGREKGFAAYQTHSAICSAGTGVVGQSEGPGIVIASASPTGVGRAMLDIVRWNPEGGFAHDQVKNRWPFSYYGDSGYLSNRYGRNPMRQGRDFMSCLGNVPNPGFGKEGGFMSDSKTLTFATASGRRPGCGKNGLSMGVIPGVAIHDFDAPINPTTTGDSPAATDVTPPAPTQPSQDSGCAIAETNDWSKNLSFLAASAGLLVIVSRLRKRSAR